MHTAVTTGSSADARGAVADGAERSSHSGVDAGHLDMGNLRSPSVTTPSGPSPAPGSGPGPALSSRRGSVETPHVTANRVGLHLDHPRPHLSASCRVATPYVVSYL